MKLPLNPIRSNGPARRELGVSLIVVMVMLLLGSIVVLGSTRVGWLNEKLVGNQGDYQRTFAAAEAVLRDAERDIKGLQNDGITPCNASAAFVGCRDFGSGRPFFPQDEDDLDTLKARIGSNVCLQGICLPATVTAFSSATFPDSLGTMTAGTGTAAIAATYGQFTGLTPAAVGNPLLTGASARAWYWVEVFHYESASGILNATANVPAPDMAHPFVYRITAYVQGQKPGSRVWLRSIFVPLPQNQNK
ncbi:MAG: PilX N-terminal domain-containing pilus assembly protein [Hydrogenophaga sp.]|nr:PilX N-terminal domain-containing pilus assembly protein [Hydrogenophaga sp.]